MPSPLLLVRLSAIGDVIHALPVLAAARAARADARIGWLVEDRASSLLAGQPGLDNLHVYPRRRWSGFARRPWRWPQLLWEILKLRRELRREKYAAALDLQGNLKSALLTRLSGAARRAGPAPPESKEKSHWFYKEKIPLPPGVVHRVDRAVALAAGLDIPPPAGPPTLAIGADDKAWAAEALREVGRPRVVIHPGVSGFGAYKAWPADRWSELAKRLKAELNAGVVISWGPGERETAQRVVGAAEGAAVAATATESLGQLAALLAAADAVAGADTGPLHLAAAVGTPAVTLFGPKDPAVYAPRGPAPQVALWKKVDCAPCAYRRCVMSGECLEAISVNDVFAALKDALAPARSG